MNISNDIYRGYFYPCYRTPEGMRELSLDLIFMAENETEACEDFCIHAIRQFKLHNEYYPDKWNHIGCIKVNRFYPYQIEEGGICSYVSSAKGTPAIVSGFTGLEWKCDTGLYFPKNPGRGLVKLLEEVAALRPELAETPA